MLGRVWILGLDDFTHRSCQPPARFLWVVTLGQFHLLLVRLERLETFPIVRLVFILSKTLAVLPLRLGPPIAPAVLLILRAPSPLDVALVNHVLIRVLIRVRPAHELIS